MFGGFGNFLLNSPPKSHAFANLAKHSSISVSLTISGLIATLQACGIGVTLLSLWFASGFSVGVFIDQGSPSIINYIHQLIWELSLLYEQVQGIIDHITEVLEDGITRDDPRETAIDNQREKCMLLKNKIVQLLNKLEVLLNN